VQLVKNRIAIRISAYSMLSACSFFNWCMLMFYIFFVSNNNNNNGYIDGNYLVILISLMW